MSLTCDPTPALPSARLPDLSPSPEWTVIDSSTLRPTWSTFVELWRFREVLGAFVARAVRVKYKQAFIGVGWTVLQPLASAALFAIVLGRVAHVSSDGAPYFPFVLCGMVAWTFFSGAVGLSIESLVSEAHLMRKVYFPRELLPLACIAAGIVDLLPNVAILLLVAVISGLVPSFAWLLLPIPLFALALGAFAYGVAPAALNVYYRDLRYIIPFLLQLGMFISPVFWSMTKLPQPWRDVVQVVNPAAGAIEALRTILLFGRVPNVALLAATIGWAVVVAAAGLTLFKRLERQFVDRI